MSGVRPTSCVILAVVAAFGGSLLESTAQATNAKPSNPVINPADFETRVAHKYFTLVPGTKFTYRRETGRGTERVETMARACSFSNSRSKARLPGCCERRSRVLRTARATSLLRCGFLRSTMNLSAVCERINGIAISIYAGIRYRLSG